MIVSKLLDDRVGGLEYRWVRRHRLGIQREVIDRELRLRSRHQCQIGGDLRVLPHTPVIRLPRSGIHLAYLLGHIVRRWRHAGGHRAEVDNVDEVELPIQLDDVLLPALHDLVPAPLPEGNLALGFGAHIGLVPQDPLDSVKVYGKEANGHAVQRLVGQRPAHALSAVHTTSRR